MQSHLMRQGVSTPECSLRYIEFDSTAMLSFQHVVGDLLIVSVFFA